MYCIVQTLKSIEVKYGSQYDVPNKSIVPIFTNENSILKSIYVSTPRLVLPWPKTFSDDEKTFNIEFANENNQFIKRLKGFCMKTIKNKIDTNNGYDIDLNQIKVYNNDAHTLRFFNVKVNDISVYDETGNSISINDIIKEDYVKILFHIHAIVIKNTRVHFDMKLIQIMKMIPYLCVNKSMNLLHDFTSTKKPPVPPPPPQTTPYLQNSHPKISGTQKPKK